MMPAQSYASSKAHYLVNEPQWHSSRKFKTPTSEACWLELDAQPNYANHTRYVQLHAWGPNGAQSYTVFATYVQYYLCNICSTCILTREQLESRGSCLSKQTPHGPRSTVCKHLPKACCCSALGTQGSSRGPGSCMRPTL